MIRVSRRVFSLILVAALLIVLVCGYIGVTYNNSSQPSDGDAQAARDSVITYLSDNYPDAQNWTSNLAWSGGKQSTGTADLETYVYSTGEWTMQLNCTATSNPLYVVDANYTKGDVTLDWMGVCQNGTVAEQGYVVYSADFMATEPHQAAWASLQYMIENHQAVVAYLNAYSLAGGRVAPPEGFVGSETYRYAGVAWNETALYEVGWTVTVQYPVVPNPIYSVNITYVPDGTVQAIIDWQGTWQTESVTETLYSCTP
jgi:hypothetical protein